MTTLIEKARLGRMNALNILPTNNNQPRNRSSLQHEKVTFISSRARAQGAGSFL